MTSLILPPTRNTPSIWFEPQAGRFEMTGISVPENATEFYQPVYDWLDANLPHMADGQLFRFQLSYFNSTSLKAIFLLLKRIVENGAIGPKAVIRWCVEEDDELMIESAEMYMDLLGAQFEVERVPVDQRPGERMAS
ncbi:MAG: DUF1987 domain-containing protein [Flavobacteriales bacterium]|nr:DUF1987 domain-containing protein [Flavobacteriales bacterium]